MVDEPVTGAAGSAAGDAGGPAAESAAVGAGLLAALLEGMEVGLAAFDAAGAVTHWNRQATRLLGWTAEEAVGRSGLTGWAQLPGDPLPVPVGRERRLHELPMVGRDGRRQLVRAQAVAVHAPDGRAVGHYLAFSEVGAQIELERLLGLAQALQDDAPTGVVLVDADLRPTLAGESALHALDADRAALLGRPLAEVLGDGVQELEAALQHVLSTGKPLSGVKLWAARRTDPDRRRCWRSEFVRLASPLGEEPVPLGVAWIFEDVTETELAEQDSAVLRFRAAQLRRAGEFAAECPDPVAAACGYLDYVLAGFADRAVLDLCARATGPGAGWQHVPPSKRPRGVDAGPPVLLRLAAAPAATAAEPPVPAGVPVRYPDAHPALLAAGGSAAQPVTADEPPGASGEWAATRHWPDDTRHALCVPLRARARTLGVLTLLRGGARPRFSRADRDYATDVAARIAATLPFPEPD